MDLVERKTQYIKFNGNTIRIVELSFKQIKEVVEILGDLLRRDDLLSGLDSKEAGNVFAAITKLAAVVPDKFIDIVMIAAPGAKREDVESATANQMVDILIEVWKLNNLEDLFKKKVLPVITREQTAQTEQT